MAKNSANRLRVSIKQAHHLSAHFLAAQANLSRAAVVTERCRRNDDQKGAQVVARHVARVRSSIECMENHARRLHTGIRRHDRDAAPATMAALDALERIFTNRITNQ